MQPVSAEEASQAGAHQAHILPFLGEAGLEGGQRELETAEQGLEMIQKLREETKMREHHAKPST